MQIETIFKSGPVIPVLNFKSPQEAVDVCGALVESGIKVLEITLRHETALASIDAVAAALPDAIVGAGTVTSTALARDAQSAGAVFGVSPGLTASLAAEVMRTGWSFLPGVASLSEAMTAREAGFTHLKCFPANVVGGPAFLKAVGSVLPDLTFCPTGGVTLASAPDYLALANVGVVGGSWLTPRGADGTIDLAEVRAHAAQALQQLKS